MKTSNAAIARFCLASLAALTCAAASACTTQVTSDITIVDDGGTPPPTSTATATPTATSTSTPTPTPTASGTDAGAPVHISNGDGGTPAPAPGFSGLFATGVDDSGNLLANGATDPHYALSGNDPANPGPAALVVQPASDGTWAPNTGTSQWISVNADGNAGDSTDTYTYTATFTFTGDATTATLTGSWACDDSCTLQLNGTQVASYAAPGWLAPQTFTIPAGSPFQSGTNTLTFTVDNSGAWATGVQVFAMSGSTTG